jgi:SAM-dependent methyltransferase
VRDPADGFTVPLRDLGEETPAWRGILTPVDAPREAPAGVTAQFLEHAADYHERYANVAHFRTVLDDAFARLERPPAPRTILDIGSGSGNSVIPLLDRFPDAFVVATDISAPLLAILRDHLAANDRYRGRFALVAVDAVDAPLRPASYDLAVGAAILHHVLAPERVVDACRVALRGGGIAVFLEPFEMGHAVLSLAYAGIVDEARRRGENGPGLEMVRTLLVDYEARRRPRDDPRFLEMDDKWMFTRGFFEEAARRGRWAECLVHAIHGADAPLTEQTRVNLKLGGGLAPSALPAWAWDRLADCEQAFSPAARRDLTFECAVVMRAWPGDGTAGAARAGWWFDPDAPGRGVFVVDDDRTATVVCCHYDVDGGPAWHIAGPAAWQAGEMRAVARPQSEGVALAGAADGGDLLTLRFSSPDRATLTWTDERIALVPQHPDSASWNGGAGGERGGRWIEDRAAPGLGLVVEALDGRVFAALLAPDGWCVAVAAERRADVCAGEWMRFSGGQSRGAAYRPPGPPEVLGEARFTWTDADRLVVQLPDGRHAVLRRVTP